MDPFASPPLVVEAALRSAGITWTPTDNGREGVFHAERCPLCLNGGTLVMQWLGEAFVFNCPDGHAHAEVREALGIDPDATPDGTVRPSPRAAGRPACRTRPKRSDRRSWTTAKRWAARDRSYESRFRAPTTYLSGPPRTWSSARGRAARHSSC